MLPQLKVHKNYADVVIIGNGSAGAGAVNWFNRHFQENPDSDLSVLVLDSQTEEQISQRMPEFNARVSFPYDLARSTGMRYEDFEDTFINGYSDVAFYSPRAKVHKKLPKDAKERAKVVLLDTDKLIGVLERDLVDNIKIKSNKEVYHAEYVGKEKDRRIKLLVQYPFRKSFFHPETGVLTGEKTFVKTDEVYARAVIGCSGTGGVVLESLQGYRKDSAITCGVVFWKFINSRINPNEVALALDDKTTHGAGLWAYNNDEISLELRNYLERWFETTKNRETLRMIKGKTIDDFVGTISDVGISSIAPYSRVQNYDAIVRRQALEAFTTLAGKFFTDATVIPGSDNFKPSPVLQPVSKMAGDNYILVGDSSGLATPYIGEGVRPGVELGGEAAKIILHALKEGNLSEKRLRKPFEDSWWEKYGKYDIWSDLFRHFSSTCFNDKQWDIFFDRIQKKLSDDEFYEVLKSQYTPEIVAKMIDPRMIGHYLKFKLRQLINFIPEGFGLRQIVSWMK